MSTSTPLVTTIAEAVLDAVFTTAPPVWADPSSSPAAGSVIRSVWSSGQGGTGNTAPLSSDPIAIWMMSNLACTRTNACARMPLMQATSLRPPTTGGRAAARRRLPPTTSSTTTTTCPGSSSLGQRRSRTPRSGRRTTPAAARNPEPPSSWSAAVDPFTHKSSPSGAPLAAPAGSKPQLTTTTTSTARPAPRLHSPLPSYCAAAAAAEDPRAAAAAAAGAAAAPAPASDGVADAKADGTSAAAREDHLPVLQTETAGWWSGRRPNTSKQQCMQSPSAPLTAVSPSPDLPDSVSVDSCITGHHDSSRPAARSADRGAGPAADKNRAGFKFQRPSSWTGEEKASHNNAMYTCGQDEMIFFQTVVRRPASRPSLAAAASLSPWRRTLSRRRYRPRATWALCPRTESVTSSAETERGCSAWRAAAMAAPTTSRRPTTATWAAAAAAARPPSPPPPPATRSRATRPRAGTRPPTRRPWGPPRPSRSTSSPAATTVSLRARSMGHRYSIVCRSIEVSSSNIKGGVQAAAAAAAAAAGAVAGSDFKSPILPTYYVCNGSRQAAASAASAASNQPQQPLEARMANLGLDQPPPLHLPPPPMLPQLAAELMRQLRRHNEANGIAEASWGFDAQQQQQQVNLRRPASQGNAMAFADRR
ncbi:unnamed protein product, partial [Sphagnum tenellum]